MVATMFLDYLSKLQVTTYVGVEDFADKFNFLFTVLVLIVCTAVVTVKQYLMKPISCFMATAIGGQNLLDYVENYCWVQGTIPITYNGTIPHSDKEWADIENLKLLYYQWVPFVLGLQCILFYMPRVIWQLICYNRTGTDIQHIVTSASHAVHSTDDNRNKMVVHLARTLERMLFQHRDNREGPAADFRRRCHRLLGVCLVSKRLGTWLVASYLLVKFITLANCVGQLYLMHRLLGFKDNQTWFGLEVIHNLLTGKDWEITMVFPRVAFCYAKMKIVGATNTQAAQCVLPVNMLNEKVYAFLWCWICLAVFLTAVSIPLWFGRILCLKNRRRFIRKFLRLQEDPLQYDKSLANKFTRDFLRHDGVFILHMIALNAGDIVTSDVVLELWRVFREKYRKRNLLHDTEQANCSIYRDSQVLKLESGSASVCRNPQAPTAPPEKQLYKGAETFEFV